MISRLSSEVIEQLTLMLDCLARLVTLGCQPSDEDLQILLMDSNMESKPEVIQELRCWSRALKMIRRQPTESRRQVTAEALILRGLPEDV